MKFRNHIGYRYLSDRNFMMEGLEASMPHVYRKLMAGCPIPDLPNDQQEALKAYGHLLDTRNTKAFFVTDTVVSKLEMLRVKKNPIYDWTVFNNVPANKDYTFLFGSEQAKGNNPAGWNSGLLRVIKAINGKFGFLHLCFKFKPGSKIHGEALFTYFYVDTNTGEQCSDFYTNQNVKDIEEMTYKMLCFIFLSENEEQVILPGRSVGTKKQGKVLNDLTVPITIINSKWNVTSIRTEGFPVSGHFKLVWTGVGRQVSKMVFVEPYEKHGYVRKAKMETI